MAAVSTWMAPINAPVTTVTRSHRMAEAVKVCRDCAEWLRAAYQLVVQQRDWSMSPFYVSLLDVNECAVSNACTGGMCVNTPGSFVCENCRLGFGTSADGLSCEGFIRCESSPGFESRGHVWCLSLLLDVDECAQDNFCLGGVCANTEGSYTCTRCKAGYRVSPDRQRCEGTSHLRSPLQ